MNLHTLSASSKRSKFWNLLTDTRFFQSVRVTVRTGFSTSFSVESVPLVLRDGLTSATASHPATNCSCGRTTDMESEKFSIAW